MLKADETSLRSDSLSEAICLLPLAVRRQQSAGSVPGQSFTTTTSCARTKPRNTDALQTSKAMTTTELEQEAKRATALLAGKVVKHVWRNRAEEVGIEFADGSRVFIHRVAAEVELSITSGQGPGTSTHSTEPTQPELGPTILFAPPNGWQAFESSSALTDIFLAEPSVLALFELYVGHQHLGVPSTSHPGLACIRQRRRRH